jgi:GxxExxY protein
MEKDPQRLRNSAFQWSKDASRAYPHSDVTKKVIGAAIEVHKILGPGFMEGAYEESLAMELDRLQVPYERQRVVRVRFRGAIVDTHKLDLIVEGKVVVELKAVKEIEDVHLAVTLSYLKATDLKVGLVINFAETVLRVRRVARGIHDFTTEAQNSRDTDGDDDQDT